ncbi:hypothetical protein C8R43DRAFT_959287 [Mycena crocata]|nr:hypothetical protein C8R43DRAFT_959287 [Mycena crocata]
MEETYNPFSLSNFLSYGTLILNLVPQNLQEDTNSSFPKTWELFIAHADVNNSQNPEDHSTLGELEFLVEHQFILASHLQMQNRLCIRIYLIPHDLAGVQGQLRVRKANIVGTAARFLANLLPRLSRSRECWEACAPPGPLSTYLEPNEASAPFLPVVGINGVEFFLQPGTMQVFRERPLVSACRGGILCEELGIGKTLSEPEPSIHDKNPVLTPLAFRHFPSGEFEAARARLFRNQDRFEPCTFPHVPTLVELLLHKMATDLVTFVPESPTYRYFNLKEEVNSLEHYTAPRKDNIPFYIESSG